MISVDEALRYYNEQVECLKFVAGAVRAGTFTSSRFRNLTAQEVLERLTELRYELDRQVVLQLVASAEAAMRRDYEARLRAATTLAPVVGLRRLAFLLHLPKWAWHGAGALEEALVDLRVRFGDKVGIDPLVDAWKQAGANRNAVGEFKKLVKHRHWLAHGRYFQDRSGWAAPPDPLMAHAVVQSLFRELCTVNPTFPLA